jgi:hypothetical protein
VNIFTIAMFSVMAVIFVSRITTTCRKRQNDVYIGG